MQSEDVKICLLKLKQLTIEYVVAVEICQHRQVARLIREICVCLVELVDRELDDGPGKQCIDLELIDFISRRLRKQAELVLAYNDVLDFVSLQDSLCLQVLLGARSPADSSGASTEKQLANWSQIEVDRLAGILRKSVYLLCSINQRRQPELANDYPPDTSSTCGADANGNREELLLDKSRELDRIERFGFPMFVINTGTNLVSRPTGSFGLASNRQSNEASLSATSAPTTTTTTLEDRLQHTLLDVDWFRYFLAKSLSRHYPVDRFPVLVAIWQVAVRARHRTLRRLIGELVDQVAHEEANSCAEEELLQLSQPGSFWLSWLKRYQHNVGVHHQKQPYDWQSFNRSTTLQRSYSNDEGDDASSADEEDSAADDESSEEDEEEEAPTNSSSRCSSRSSSVSSTGSGYRPPKQPAAGRKHNPDDTTTLRRIIRRELMQNGKCVICGRQPLGDLLELVNWSFGCANCGFQSAAHRCALSFRPLALVGLRELLRVDKNVVKNGGIKRFVLISWNEWARQMLQARRTSLHQAKSMKRIRQPPVGERLLIGETFERLTVVRHRPREPSDRLHPLNGDSNSFSSSSSSSGSDSDSDSDPEDADSHSSASGPSSANQLLTTPEDKRGEKPLSVGAAGMQQLGLFAATAFNRRPYSSTGGASRATKAPLVSLSIQLMNSVMNCPGGATEELALCAGDLLLMDTGCADEQVSMKPMVAVTPVAPHSLWVCVGRSARSRLPVGCFQLFTSRALIRLGLLPATCKCPLCGHAQLTPVAGLTGAVSTD